MSQPTTAAAPNPTATADAQGAWKTPDQGTVLYPSPREAALAGQRQEGIQPVPKKLAEVRCGELYLSKSGKVLPCTPDGLMQGEAACFIVLMAAMVGFSLAWSFVSRLVNAPEAAVPDADPAAAWTAPSAHSSAAGIHPGLTDQQLVVLLTAAATEALGVAVRVDRFRPLSSGEANWAAYGRSVLHSHRLK